jgi:hypothetical protein
MRRSTQSRRAAKATEPQRTQRTPRALTVGAAHALPWARLTPASLRHASPLRSSYCVVLVVGRRI